VEGVNVDNLVGGRQMPVSVTCPMWITVWITYVLGIDTEGVINRDRGRSPARTCMRPRTCSCCSWVILSAFS